MPCRQSRRRGHPVNGDTIYLNQFINETRKGTFKGLNNEKLRGFGQKQKYYPGVPDILRTSKLS